MAHRNVVLIGFDPFLQRDSTQRDNYLNTILRRAGDAPGVESAALSTTVLHSLAGIENVIGLNLADRMICFRFRNGGEEDSSASEE